MVSEQPTRYNALATHFGVELGINYDFKARLIIRCICIIIFFI
ncbi:hypothetical protein Ga0061079_102179 [Apibacter mensalis]|uniref:Uncharacterized protein n=1 Tax=Apibacter mensalis TaxID=1586267 RepID=A0A0X3AP13_9FLAO|nr:hypothetical protein Ga0061079_102179 [Apibacter mensalis]